MTSRFRWQLPETDYRAPAPPAAGRRPVPGSSANRQLPGAGPRALPGQPTFQLFYCSWTRGCKWSMALALSITLGGFGADRFYLGQWREGLCKLFSFGGLGIWC